MMQRGQPQQGLLSLSVLEADRRRSGGWDLESHTPAGPGKPICYWCPWWVAVLLTGSSFEAACPPSACQLPSLQWLPTKASWAGGGAEAMLRLGVVGCPRQGWATWHPCSIGRWVSGAVLVSCDHGPLGLPPLFLVVAEQQAKIYFWLKQIALQWDDKYLHRHTEDTWHRAARTVLVIVWTCIRTVLVTT